MKATEHERRDWIIVLVILLFGLLCVIFAGQWALVFAPNWQLNADMGSRLNPNLSLLGNGSDTVVEAINPSILTAPVWFNVFLTPGATIPAPIPPTPTPLPPPTSTRRANPSPTAPATIVFFPATSTNTSIPVSTHEWTSTVLPTKKPPAAATPTNTVTINSKATATNIATQTNTPTFTPTITPTNTPTLTPSITNTPLPEADLQITITDGISDYVAGSSLQYTIVASNPVGPSGVIDARVSVKFSAHLTDVSWSCFASAGAFCGQNGSGKISDSVNLPVGSSVTYIASGTVAASASADLASTATIRSPVGIKEAAPDDNQATDTDQPVVVGILPLWEHRSR